MSPFIEYAAADGAALAEVVFAGCAFTASVVRESVVVVGVAGVVVPSVGVAVVVEDVVGVDVVVDGVVGVASGVSLSSTTTRPAPGDRTVTAAPPLETDVDAGCLPVGRALGPVDLFAPPVVVE
jgi:hypothetical protein